MERQYDLKELKKYLDGKLQDEISQGYNKLYEVSFLADQNRFNGFKLVGDVNEDTYKQLNLTLLWDWNINPNNNEVSVSNLKEVLDVVKDTRGNMFIVTSCPKNY